MKLCLLLSALFLSSTANALSNDELVRCTHIALTFSQSPTTPTVGELDALRLCVTDLMAQKVQAPKDEAIDKAIRNNFGRDGDQ